MGQVKENKMKDMERAFRRKTSESHQVVEYVVSETYPKSLQKSTSSDFTPSKNLFNKNHFIHCFSGTWNESMEILRTTFNTIQIESPRSIFQIN